MPVESPLVEADAGLSTRAFGVGLVVLAFVFVLVAWLQYSPAMFGVFHDDTLYFSSAKALAEGQGAVLPNLPNAPAQTKYPPLYPLLLSVVWRIQPEFPSNLVWAWGLNVLFGVGLVLSSVAVLCRLGSGRKEALALGALFALNPYTILWTNLLLSDVLFALLTLLSVLAAERAFQHPARRFWFWWAAAVVIALLAISTRTLGIALPLGLFLYAASKKRFLAAAVACVGVLPTAWRLLAGWMAGSAALSGGAVSGFDQNWLYYTSYLDFWKLSVPNWDVLSAQVQFTALELFKYPAVAAVFFNGEGMASIFMQTSAVAISVAVLHGVVLRVKQNGLSVLHWMAICYLPFVLLWNYTLMSRFCLAFVPLLLVGAYVEFSRLATAVNRIVRQSAQKDQRIAAGLMGLALASLVANGAWRFAVEVPRGLHSVAAQRERTLEAKKQAYDWIASESEPGPVISYEDGLLYLYAGVDGMRPFSESTEPFFLQDEEAMKRDISRLGDTAVALNARYWLVSDDDFELSYAGPQLESATEEILRTSPIVFRSDDGSVRVHELDAARTRAAK